MSLENIQKEAEQVRSSIHSIQVRLSGLPNRNLICINNGKYVKSFQSEGSQRIYISKKDAALLPKLVKKKYLSALLSDLYQEQAALNAYLKQYRHYQSQVDKLSTNPAYRQILQKYLIPVSEDLAEWMSQPYEKNEAYPENLRHTCLSGNIVRSKSEALIDQALFNHQLPYRYECKLLLGSTTMYPDFTILHPQTRKLIYWEHFGLMAQPQYASKAFSKMHLYNANQIIPSIHLITTFETSDHPLTMSTIEALIQHYFL